MDIAKQIKDCINISLAQIGLSQDFEFVIERPGDMAHGDYATNVAFAISKQIGASPKDAAIKLKDAIDSNLPEFIEKVEIAGPGFINFILKQKYFSYFIESLVQNESIGFLNIHGGKKILVEHSSPNLFKPFHIGHMMNNTIGESIVRLAKRSGAEVYTMSFPSDISLGVAKAIWHILKNDSANILDEEKTLEEKINFLGLAYTNGVQAYDADESIHSLVNEIANNLYEQKNSPQLDLFLKCKKLNIEYFEQVVKKLGSHFDSYIYESEAGIDGKRIVLANTPNVFTESQGAIVYIPEEEKNNIHTAVFINSQGNPTYEAKDIGLLDLKFKKYNPDLSIFITDVQQASHFAVVLDAANKINKEWATKSIHRMHGRMSFKGQKMSSRLGGVPLVTEIVGVVKDEVMNREGSRVDQNDAENVAIGAVKFAILKNMAGKNINFDPDTSLSFEGDSGPYLQYTAVRLNSLLEKANEKGMVISYDIPSGWETTKLEKTLLYFNESLKKSISEWAPHHLVLYLISLAQEFNSFYANMRIVDGQTGNEQYALALAHATKKVLISGLDVLAINVPKKM